MKKSKIWAIANLAMTALILLLFVFACTYEVDAFEAHAEKLKEQGEKLAGLGALGLVIIIAITGIIYGVAVIFLTVSWLGLFKADKWGLLITGAIGKLVAIGGMLFMGAGSVSTLARVLYAVLSAAYLAGAILDILFCKRVKE